MLPKLKTQKGREGGGVAKRPQLKFEILGKKVLKKNEKTKKTKKGFSIAKVTKSSVPSHMVTYP